jgi:hypothetical protein
MRILSVLAFLMVLAFPAPAGQMEVPLEFPLAGMETDAVQGWSRLSLPGCLPWGSPGEPLLPVRAVTAVVPAGATGVEVEVVAGTEVELGRFRPVPVRPPRPFSAAGPAPDPLEGEAYRGSDPWPRSPLRTWHCGSRSGYTLVSAVVCPLRWDPGTGVLWGCGEATVRISWRGTSPRTVSARQSRRVSRRLRSLVVNPADLAACAPPTGAGRSLDYLVVTSEDYSDSFAELVDYKNSCGLATEMAYIEDILASSPGWDDAEKLRNYITDRWELDGISYVLLAGDGSVVPTREIYLYCEGYDDTAPCDLYFSDLDGDWDASGDHQYGQPEDDLDLYADVAVGRALFDTPEEAAVFVERSIMYGQSPPPGGWSSRAMLCGAGLFTGYTGAKVCDSIAARLPGDWEVNKAYEDLGLSDGFTTHIDIIESGTNWNHYAGHGNTTGIYWQGYPSSMMTNSIASDLTNGDRAGIHHSIGCHPGAFHSGECCAEALWHNAGGGASSVMFNSSYGWEGYIPEMGVSEWMCVYLTEEVFELGNGLIGPAFATSKDRRVPLWSGGHDRELYCIMDWNAYHDPTLAVLQSGAPVAGGQHPVPGGAVTLRGPWPNPAARGEAVLFEAGWGAGDAELEVWDLSGRLQVSRRLDGTGPVRLDTARDGAALPAGLYIVRLSAPGGCDTGRMTVLAR